MSWLPPENLTRGCAAIASGDLPDFVEDQKERRLLTVVIDGRDVDPHRLAVWRHASYTFIDDAVAELRDDVDCVLVERGFGVSEGRLRAVDLERGERTRLILRIVLAVALRNNLDEVRVSVHQFANHHVDEVTVVAQIVTARFGRERKARR